MASERKRKFLYCLLAILVVCGAVAAHYRFDPWGFYHKVSPVEAALRLSLVETAQNWLGCRESDGSHQKIIDSYNAHEPLAMDYVVQYTDSWCAAFVSAAAIESGLTDIIPTECGCERQIGLFRELGSWEESDWYLPSPGDVIYYDWDQKKPGECTGWSDHVGIVMGTKWPFVKVIEGNCDDQVKTRVILLGDVTIRGYGLPEYAKKAS